MTRPLQSTPHPVFANWRCDNCRKWLRIKEIQCGLTPQGFVPVDAIKQQAAMMVASQGGAPPGAKLLSSSLPPDMQVAQCAPCTHAPHWELTHGGHWCFQFATELEAVK